MGISSIIQSSRILAIIGMEAAWAGCEDLDAFVKMTYEGRVSHLPVFHPTAAGEDILAQAARRALLNAGVGLNQPGLHIAALAAGAQPLNAGWNWAANFLDLSGCSNPLTDALRLASEWLFNGESGEQADVVVFTAGAGLPDLPPSAPLSSDPKLFLALIRVATVGAWVRVREQWRSCPTTGR